MAGDFWRALRNPYDSLHLNAWVTLWGVSICLAVAALAATQIAW